MKKIFLLFIIVLFFSILGSGSMQASGNIFGWAWTENIGWISFNNLGYGTCPGANCIPAGGGSYNYGVNIETNGNLIGYAWSENIGWIKFDSLGTSYPTTPSYSACLDLPSSGQACDGAGNYTVTGWARACSVFASGCSGTLNSSSINGGWDGWIKMNDISPNGLYIDISSSPAQFHKWVWGSDDLLSEAVIGWGTFNCKEGGASGENICGSSSYKVVTTFAFNSPPTATLNVSPSENDCNSGAGAGSVLFSWTYTDPDNNPESRFEFKVFRVDDNYEVISYDTGYGLSNPSGTINSQQVYVSSTTGNLAFNTNYYWRVQVYDSNGSASGWVNGSTFRTSTHAWPSPNFTYLPVTPLIKNPVYFADLSTCYDANNGAQSCSTTGNRTYNWTFGTDGSSTTKGDVSHTFNSAGTYAVTLQICETPGVNCCTSSANNVPVKKSIGVPEWKEISPF